jgi:hypothetical protein
MPRPPFTVSRVFTLKEATYYCNKSLAKVAPASYRELVEKKLPRGRELVEGTAEFENFRSQALWEADRSLFLALSNFRRSQDLMSSSSAYWSWVTSYYSAHYSASTILSLLGVCVSPQHAIIDVVEGKPGSQRLQVEECPTEGPTGESGGHRIFWDFCYTYLAQLRSYLPNEMRALVEPIRKTRSWLISNRNLQNYDTFLALETCASFRDSFNEAAFPGNLFSTFRDQYQGSKSLLDVALWLVYKLGFRTEALSGLCGGANLKNRTERMIGRMRPPFTPGRELLERPSASRPWLAVRF